MEQKNNRIRKQTTVMLCLILTIFGVLAGQLGNMTHGRNAVFAADAHAQQTRTLPLFAPRGIIYDRHMEPLATNQLAHSAIVRYPHFNNPEILAALSGILDLPQEQIEQRVKQQAGRPYEPVVVAENLKVGQYTAILERNHELPGVEILPHAVRLYPQGQLGAHLLGYVSQISESELERLRSQGYLPAELVGQAGIEAWYEPYLRGAPGSQDVLVNSAFEPVETGPTDSPAPGHNLVLTIDARLQRVTERSLDWTMHRLRTIPHAAAMRAFPNAQAGAAVVMDVNTGAILAMTSRPTFDPNLFVGAISEADWERLNNNPFTPLINRAIQGAYQPGSTWKMMTGAAALAAGVTNPTEQVFSGREYEPTGQRDWVPWGHGWVDLANALRLSSNIYFYEMGRRLSIERLVEYAQGFGFGRPTGIDLGGEAEGFMPDAAFRKRNDWYPGHTTSAAIGQIFTATPLQLANYAAAIANGGRLMQPYLVQSIHDAAGSVVKQTEPRQTGTLPVPDTALQAVIEGMRLVNLPGGTADFAIWPLPGIATAGKTGTTENPPKDDNGVYVAFAPLENPQIAVAIVVEQGGHGSAITPIARAIFAEYFGVELRQGDPARVPDDFE